jgi:hypothetical protein
MWWSGACTAEVAVGSVEVALMDGAPTVVVVSWTTDPPAPGHVSFGVNGSLDRRSRRSEAAERHEVTLVGLPPDTSVAVQVVVDGAGEVEPESSRTGSLDGVQGWALQDEPMGDFVLTPAVVNDVATLTLVDPLGTPTWSHTDTRGLGVFRARLLPDGSGVVYTVALEAGQPSPDSGVVRVTWAGEETFVAVADLAHDFVLDDAGDVISLASDTRDGIQGDRIVAIATDGAQTDLWSTFDTFDPVADPGDDPIHGWTHANALDRDAGTGLLLAGLRNLGTIAAVDPETGSSPWSFGRAGSVRATGAVFVHQHQFEWLGDRFFVFDNDGAPGNESRVLEYDFNPANASAPLRRELFADPPLYSFILGDIHEQEGGDLLVTWSVPGIIDRMAPDGARKSRVTAPAGTVLGFATVIDEPSDP